MTEDNQNLPAMGYNGSDADDAKRVYILTLPEDVTAKGDDVITVDDVYYCAENAKVSLTSKTPLEVDGVRLSKNTDGTYAYTMIAEDVEIDISAVDDSDTVDNGIKYNKAKTSATVTSAFKGHTLTADDYDSDVEKINASKISRSFTIYGNDNDNSIRGGSGRNTIDGGRGDDTLRGGDGNDLFVWTAGDDLIADYAEGDKISLDGATVNDDDIDVSGKNLTFNFNGGSLTVKNGVGKKITFVDDGKKVTNIFDAQAKYDKNKTFATLVSDFDGTFTASKTVKKIDGSKSDGAKIIGNTLNNSILGGDGDETLDGGKGNDTLTGGDGDDLFIWSAGNDVVTDYTEDDSIKISGVTSSNVYQNDVVLHVGDSGKIKILDGAGKKITVVDANGKTDTRIYRRHMVFDGDQTAVTLDSTFGGTFDASDYENLETINAAAVESNGVKLYGNDNDNSIRGGTRGDILTGGKGDDTLTGGAGNDKFVWTAGNDEITDYAEGDKISVDGALELENISVSGKNVKIKFDDGSLTIDNALGKKISISDDDGSHTYIFDKFAAYNAEKTSATLLSATNSFIAPDDLKVIDGSLTKKAELVGNDLGNSIIGGTGNDTLWGMAGNDSIYGGAGNDIFLYLQGEGNDTIFDYANGDTLLIFGDTAPKNKFVGRDCVISIDTGSITLKDFVGSGSTTVNMRFIQTS